MGKGNLSVKNLRMEDQHADIFTKAIGQKRFEKHPLFSFRDIIFLLSVIGVCVLEAC